MPAIDLERLRTKITLLKGIFSQAPALISELREIYMLYADRTRPLANYQVEVRSPSAFNTPQLLNREFEDVLSEFGFDQPQELLNIIDLLWLQPEIEFRQLAAALLGKLPREMAEEVIKRITEWSADARDVLLLPYLHEHASLTLRRSLPMVWLKVLETWKESEEAWQNKLSIQGIISLIDDRNFSNLPVIFTFLTPLFLQLKLPLQHDLRIALDHLVQRSEVETVYFLKLMIAKSRNPDFARFVRRSLDMFTLESQNSLRDAMRHKS